MISDANKCTLEDMLKSSPIVLYGAGFAGAFISRAQYLSALYF
ncbi:MAG: hypothetical protein RR508_05735 [Oscillospiraceae bacterium]